MDNDRLRLDNNLHPVQNIKMFNMQTGVGTQGYYPDIYSAQEKWQEAGQKFRVLLIEIPLDLYCVVF